MVTIPNVAVSKTKLWCAVIVLMNLMVEAAALNGPNVCMVQQKYNITKRVKYRAPMTVRTYEWCFSMPPRCSKWKTEMRELTKLETDERIAEVAVCCPGYKMKEVSCVPICPNGKTGHRCSDVCPPNKWGPNCVNDCEPCNNGTCSPFTGDCFCQEGWQGESCEIRMQPSTSTTTAEDLLTKAATKPTLPTISSSRPVVAVTTSSGSLATTQLSRSTETSIKSTETSTSKTTSLEHTTNLSRLKTIIESSVLNRTTSLETTLLPSKNTYLEKTTTLTTTSTPSTTVQKTSTFGEKTINSTAAIEQSTSIISNFTPPRMVATTLKPVTTTLETFTSISMTEVATTKASKVILKTNTTTLVPFQETENMVKAENTTPSTTESVVTTIQSGLTNITNEVADINQAELTTIKTVANPLNSQTEDPVTPKRSLHEQKVPIRLLSDTKINVEVQHFTEKTLRPKTNVYNTTVTEVITSTTPFTTTTARTTLIETTRRPESTIRYFPTTVKFKPKEIWIRPAQKGESFMKAKTETNHEINLKHKVATSSPNTTPKTIIVSIIPTSVSYATFKKIALTTALSSLKNTTVVSFNGTTEHEVTRPMSTLTTTESPSISIMSNITRNFFISSNLDKSKYSSKSEHIDRTTKSFSTFHTTREFPKNKKVSKNGTNSMTTVENNLNSSNFLTTSSTNAIRSNLEQTTSKITKYVKVTKHPFIQIDTVKRNVTIITVSGKNKNETVKITKTTAKDVERTNATRIRDVTEPNPITESPEDEEKFHILTEPEHITAVMEGKGKERASVDLISVISIAGGIMMAVITVAVIIVMVERCKRPRYDDVRKVSDIHMKVMIDNNDVPPPYVRSIFHTPLPDPPSSEKCHYQPISTLDRNLKQFMRPVVVQNISPIMLENFRGILECHYDHLPRRSHNFETVQRHFSIAPSVDDVDELTRLRPCSEMDATIEALKCEARLDVIDSTTSEPLYAEIPCWRPPSEHAIEIMNLNGEAVTEL